MITASELAGFFAAHAIWSVSDGATLIPMLAYTVRAYFAPTSTVILAVPYTPKGDESPRFRVHKPKLLEWSHCEDFDQRRALDAFFRGVDAHEQGAAVWNAALDQSK